MADPGFRPIPLATGMAVAAGRMERQVASTSGRQLLCCAQRKGRRHEAAGRDSAALLDACRAARAAAEGELREQTQDWSASFFDALRDTGAKFSRNLALSCMHDPPVLPLH